MRLAGGQARPEALTTEPFHLLPQREPKETILRSFDLTVIGRHFPEYERELRKRLVRPRHRAAGFTASPSFGHESRAWVRRT